MRTKKVNRYYCDFCKKSGCAAGHMKNHEKHCTLNPNRVCRMCGHLGEAQPELPKLIALLPNPKDYETDLGVFVNLEEPVEKAMGDLREAANDCPMCIMAALRQKGIPVPLAESFHYTEELKAIWDSLNTENIDYAPY